MALARLGTETYRFSDAGVGLLRLQGGNFRPNWFKRSIVVLDVCQDEAHAQPVIGCCLRGGPHVREGVWRPGGLHEGKGAGGW
jgi:hypothetical protein